MENRDRHKMSKNTSSANVHAGKKENRSDSSVEFGQKIGRNEDLNNEPGSRIGSQSPSGIKGSGNSNLGGSKVDRGG